MSLAGGCGKSNLYSMHNSSACTICHPTTVKAWTHDMSRPPLLPFPTLTLFRMISFPMDMSHTHLTVAVCCLYSHQRHTSRSFTRTCNNVPSHLKVTGYNFLFAMHVCEKYLKVVVGEFQAFAPSFVGNVRSKRKAMQGRSLTVTGWMCYTITQIRRHVNARWMYVCVCTENDAGE